jgi:hypothetical protein
MIVNDEREGLLLIDQEAHARLTGDLAARLPFPVPHHAAFVAAARVHDNGWREADQAPTVDERGRPHSFNNVPDDRYEQLWRRGIERVADVDALVGLFVGLHGARFFETRESPGMRRLVEQERERQTAVLTELGLGGRWDALPEPVQEASDWIAMLDALSLLLCGASLPDQITPRVAGIGYTLTRTDQATVGVDPWPYEGGPFTLSVAARHLSSRIFADDEELRDALARTDVFEREVSLVPAD